MQSAHQSTDDTARLISSLSCDVVAAASASAAISPIVAIVDSSIVQLTALEKRGSILSLLWRNAKPLLHSPSVFLRARPTRLLFLVYMGTYTTANTFDSVHDTFKNSNFFNNVVPAVTLKLLSVTAISTSLTVYKDSRLARMFGAKPQVAHPAQKTLTNASSPLPSPSRNVQLQPRVPLSAYSLFTLRDLLTIYACFVLPPIVATKLDQFIEGNDGKQLTRSDKSPSQASARLVQLTLPALLQFFSTPIHLLALDLNNRQQRLTLSDRAARVGRDLGPAVFTRMLRIVPAFGVGGILNTEIRKNLKDRFNE